jgi:hypothetical protein
VHGIGHIGKGRDKETIRNIYKTTTCIKIDLNTHAQATVAEQTKIDKAWKTQLAAMKKAEQTYKDAAASADAAYEAFLQGKQVRGFG